MYFVIPMWVMIIGIILTWSGVLYLYWFKPKVMPKIDEYFAHRRHLRRLRKMSATRGQVAVAQIDYQLARKAALLASARHRR